MSKVIINVHNTNFEAIVLDKTIHSSITMLRDRYTTHSYLYSKPPFKGARPKLTVVPDKLYYTHLVKTNRYRFPSTVLKDFILILAQHGVKKDEITVNIDKEFEIAPLDIAIKDTYKPKEYQERYINALIGKDAKNIALIDLIMGYGKAQPLDSKIKIPDGWSTIGDIRVGDTIINVDGTYGKVTGKYPQGKKRIYKLRFEDGRTTRSTLEHLWKIYPDEFRDNGYVVNCERLIELLYSGTDTKVYVDLPTEYDNALIDELTDAYEYGKNISLNESQVFNNLYYEGSIEQRVLLLQGLLWDKKWSYFNDDELIFTFKDDRLVPHIIELSRSLGDIASIDMRESFSYESTGTMFVVKIYTKKPYRYFVKPVPNEDYKETVNTYLKEVVNVDDEITIDYFELLPLKIELVEVTLDGYEETCCISVDHQDQLYVTDNHIVTHNTFISVFSIVKLNMRTLILILPKYIDKWIGDIAEYTTADVKKDVCVIKGGESLQELMSMKEIPYKFIIVSMRTMSIYVKEYEQDEFNYPVTPEQLIRKLKVGVVLNDETHQEFHALFKASLYLDPPKFIGMTATIETKDKVQERMYKARFPDDVRISNLVEYVRYITVKATAYRMDSIRGIKYKRAQGYNHILFEQSILRKSFGLRNYVCMIEHYIMIDYINRRKPGEKALVFAASIDLCSILANHFKKKYPTLDIRRYVEDDPYENVMNADLCFSTKDSAGTGLDVKNLISVFQTVSISSMQSNLQVFGRLRDSGPTEKIFRYLFCRNIPDQQRLHVDRRNALHKYAKFYEQEEYNTIVRIV